MVFLLPWLVSCQGSSSTDYTLQKQTRFSDYSDSTLSEKIVLAEKELKSVNFELEWLDLKQKISSAQHVLQESKISSLKLERELVKFQNFENRFPHDRGFISESEEVNWQSRLKVKQTEVKRLRAVVRLLQRDMRALEAKLNRNGYTSVKRATFLNDDEN